MDTTTIGDFYGTTAQIAFVLLGLWWAVVEFRHRVVRHDAATRRTAYLIALHFTLLGTMSLLATLPGAAGTLWNIAFVIGGVVGAGAGVAALVALESRMASIGWPSFLAHAVAVPLYALVVVVALVAEPLAVVIDAPALAVEAVLIALLLLVGVHLAWLEFVREQPGETA